MPEPGNTDLLEPIAPADWVATPAQPTVPQLEPDPITEADLEAETVDNSLYTDPTVEQPAFPTATSTPSTIRSEKPIEAPVRLRG